MEISFSKVAESADDPAYDVLVDGAIIGRAERRWLLRRGFSKSVMSTWHRNMWSVSVADVDGLNDDDRRSLRREMKRDKTSRDAAVRYLIEAYEKAGVPLPEAPPEDARAA
jgi:hypothetical protein